MWKNKLHKIIQGNYEEIKIIIKIIKYLTDLDFVNEDDKIDAGKIVSDSNDDNGIKK